MGPRRDATLAELLNTAFAAEGRHFSDESKRLQFDALGVYLTLGSADDAHNLAFSEAQLGVPVNVVVYRDPQNYYCIQVYDKNESRTPDGEGVMPRTSYPITPENGWMHENERSAYATEKVGGTTLTIRICQW